MNGSLLCHIRMSNDVKEDFFSDLCKTKEFLDKEQATHSLLNGIIKSPDRFATDVQRSAPECLFHIALCNLHHKLMNDLSNDVRD